MSARAPPVKGSRPQIVRPLAAAVFRPGAYYLNKLRFYCPIAVRVRHPRNVNLSRFAHFSAEYFGAAYNIAKAAFRSKPLPFASYKEPIKADFVS